MFNWINSPFLELVFSVLVDVQFDLFAMLFITPKKKKKKNTIQF